MSVDVAAVNDSAGNLNTNATIVADNGTREKVEAAASWADVAKRGLPAAAAVQPVVLPTPVVAPSPTAVVPPSKIVVHHQQKNRRQRPPQNKRDQVNPLLNETTRHTTHQDERTTVATAKTRSQPPPVGREQVYVAPLAPPPLAIQPPCGANIGGTGGGSNTVWYIPLYADLVRLEVCAAGSDDPQTTVLYCHVPLLGDRLCDFHLVGNPSLLKRVQCVRLGAIGVKQNQVWLEWSEQQFAAGFESAGGYVVRVDAGGILRSIPNATRTGIAINVVLRNNTVVVKEKTKNNDDQQQQGAESQQQAEQGTTLYVVTRQQHVVNMVRNYMMSVENDTFRVCRHSGFVFVCPVAHPADNVAQWRAARAHQASLYGEANVSVDVLPEKSGPMLPLLECDPWADAVTTPHQNQVSEATLSIISMLLRSKEAPSSSDLAALHLD